MFSLDLIHEFLDISKIEAGIFDLNLSRHNYMSFLTDNVKRNAMLAKKKSQKIVIKTSLTEIQFCFDKNKIEQVLNNLLGNAIKYSVANTQITIEVSSSENWVNTRIVDEGQGIPLNELGTVFHPFQTTSVKATSNEKSTGLGLAIVKKIIESHHGTVTVESEVGKGSVFSFKIPLASC